MGKTNHINTAVKALKKQREKFVIEKNKAKEIADQALKNEKFFLDEIDRIDTQIEALQNHHVEV